MTIPIPRIERTFGDFAILAILFAVMYLLSVTEIWLSPEGKAAAGISLKERKFAATFAFFGIFLALVAGIISGIYKGDSFFLVIPALGFVLFWGYFHYRTMSKLFDVQAMIDHLNTAYRDEIMEVLKQNPDGVTLKDIYESVVERGPYTRALTLASPLLKRVLPIPIGDIVNLLQPTMDKTEKTLSELQQNKNVKLEEGKYYLRTLIDPK